MRSPSRDEWLQLQPQLEHAVGLPPNERSAYIQEAFPDEALRAWVGAYVDGASNADFLDTLDPGFVAQALHPTDRPVALDTRIGPYRLIREIGRGGMGAVYLAARSDGQFEQEVALKLIQGSSPSAEARRRFLVERQILATLEHPNVARLVDGAVTDAGQPWFAMEYVDGAPIDDWADERRLGVNDRLQLFLTTCDAVQAAHQRLVVHRDLKPSNILVTDAGLVKLLDFGIAKLLADSDASATRTGLLSFTPEYASPEQWRGEPVSTASDVYSLGVILYELLVGARPYTLRGRPDAEWREIVLAGKVVGPSAAVSAAAAERRGVSAERLRKRVRGDLDTIVLTALRLESSRRYQTVGQLAADVRRHLDGLPIGARPDTWRYRTTKFVRRNALGVGAATAVAVSVVGGAIGTGMQARRATREAERTANVRTFLESVFSQADPEHARGDSVTAGEMLDRARASLDTAFASDLASRVELLTTLGRIYRDFGRLATADSLLAKSVATAAVFEPRGGLATGRALSLQSSVQLAAGSFAEADSTVRRAVGLLRGTEEGALLSALGTQGAVLRRLGRHAASESTYREAIRIAERTADSASLGSFWGDLSTALFDAGRRTGADSAIRRALDIHLKVLPPDDPGLVLYLGNLASSKSNLWQLDSAELLGEDVVRRQKRNYPDGHERVAIALNNLGFINLRREDWGKAEAQFREAYDIVAKVNGPEYFTSLIVRNNIGRTLLLAGRAQEAEAIFRPVLSAATRVLGPDHGWPSLPTVLLARAAIAQGRYAESRSLLTSALGLARRALPPTHPRAAEVEVALGSLALAEAKPGDAVAPLRSALAWQMANHAPLEPETAETALQLARALAQLGQRSEADSLFGEAARRLEQNPYRTAHARAARLELEQWRRRWGMPRSSG